MFWTCPVSLWDTHCCLTEENGFVKIYRNSSFPLLEPDQLHRHLIPSGSLLEIEDFYPLTVIQAKCLSQLIQSDKFDKRQYFLPLIILIILINYFSHTQFCICGTCANLIGLYTLKLGSSTLVMHNVSHNFLSLNYIISTPVISYFITM